MEDHIRPVVSHAQWAPRGPRAASWQGGTTVASRVGPSWCCTRPPARLNASCPSPPHPTTTPPQVRRYIPLPTQRKIMNDCWDETPPEGWFQVGGGWGGGGTRCLTPCLTPLHRHLPTCSTVLLPPVQVLPLVVRHLPTLEQRATYLRAFL